MIVTLRILSDNNGQHLDKEATVEVTREDLPGGFETMSGPGTPIDTRDQLTALAMHTLKAALDMV